MLHRAALDAASVTVMAYIKESEDVWTVVGGYRPKEGMYLDFWGFLRAEIHTWLVSVLSTPFDHAQK